MTTITNKTFDEERALYAAQDVLVKDCAFDGSADGESAFKEGRDVAVDNCFFNLRYPFWHDIGLKIENSEMTQLCRAALWYSENVPISKCVDVTSFRPNLAGLSMGSQWRTAPQRVNIL